MKNNLSKSMYAAIATLFIAMFSLPQQVQAQSENFITIDGVKKSIVSTKFVGGNGDANAFSVTLYLSEDKKEFVEVCGNKDLHANYDYIELNKYESVHVGKWYWIITYVKGNSIPFFSSGIKDDTYSLFSSGKLYITGDPRPSRKVCSIQLSDGKITDTKNGDKEEHTITIDYKHERKAPTAGKLTVDKITENSIALSWTHATDETTPQDKLRYELYCKKDGAEDCEEVFFNTTSYTLTNLKPGTQYSVKLQATDESGNSVTYAEQTVTTTSQTQEVYNLKIAGVAVTSANCNDLSVIKGVTGKAKYDNDSKTLTLDGATIHATAAHGLENRIDGLVVRLTNENTITSDNQTGIWNMDKEVRITGNGKLTLTGSSTASDDKYNKAVFNQGTITIRDCNVEASGGSNGFYGGYWAFDNCNVRVKGGSKSNSTHKGSIAWVWDRIPTFTDCAITSPVGAYWEEVEEYEYPYFYLYGADRDVVTDWVVITQGATGIKPAATDTAAKKHGIYTLDGARISGKFENLPAGIYIVDGKKTVKK